MCKLYFTLFRVVLILLTLFRCFTTCITMVKVKICCIQSPEEATMAVQAGASALGLVSWMPSGPGVIDENTIAAIAQSVPGTIRTFLLTSHQSSAAIVEQHRRCGTTTIQLVDRLLEGTHDDIRRDLPGIELVQVVHVLDESSVNEALNISSSVDALLLDSGNPSLAVKELGGTGRTHNWEFSRRIVESVNIPVYLAGGLRPENVAQAVRAVNPYSIDVCSGVRTENILDINKLHSLFRVLQDVN